MIRLLSRILIVLGCAAGTVCLLLAIACGGFVTAVEAAVERLKRGKE